MLQFRELTKEEIHNLFSIAYNRVMGSVDLIILELIQKNLDLGFDQEEAITDILTDYRRQSKTDNSTIIEFLGKYRTLYNDFFDDITEFNWSDYTKKCILFMSGHLFQFRNDFIVREFDNEALITKYFQEKILCYEISNRMKDYKAQSSNPKTENEQKIDIPTENKPIVIQSNREAMKDMFRFNRNNENYLYEYLEELKSVFEFSKISNINFNAVCLAIYEKGIFKKGTSFRTVTESIASYYNIDLPKESKPNKCEQRKKELLHSYSILERQFIF